MRITPFICLFAAALACQAPAASGDLADTTDRLQAGEPLQLPGGMIQRVTLSPTAPVSGRNVTIRSVIVNGGPDNVSLSSRICSLDFGGTLKLTWPPELAKCAGYSMQQDLAPGDSVVGHDVMRVDSPPGEYTLRVRHALVPDAWYELDVLVVPVGP
jgi:hypothetical protein